ncbi:hypothetical protein MHBO_004108, partial [Bonamia ostreae]
METVKSLFEKKFGKALRPSYENLNKGDIWFVVGKESWNKNLEIPKNDNFGDFKYLIDNTDIQDKRYENLINPELKFDDLICLQTDDYTKLNTIFDVSPEFPRNVVSRPKFNNEIPKNK